MSAVFRVALFLPLAAVPAVAQSAPMLPDSSGWGVQVLTDVTAIQPLPGTGIVTGVVRDASGARVRQARVYGIVKAVLRRVKVEAGKMTWVEFRP
jgi:hypothetical protein